jgi:hypothetical protein
VAGIAGARPWPCPWRAVRWSRLLAWAAVGIPLLIGVWITLQKAIVLFK